MRAALVVMAAGLGSRYGGVKQVERVGPGGEILMEYAIFDAVQAGFDRIVVIVQPHMLADVKKLFGNRVQAGSGVEICYAAQRMDRPWHGIPIPPARTKPLGTLHALLSAADFLDRPFAAINADDFYGRGAVNAMAAALPDLRSGEALMAAYRLERTVSPFGAVTRGVCSVEDGLLKKVTETFKIRAFSDGTIRDTSESEDGKLLAPGMPVSMNFWGFHPDVLKQMDARLEDFLRRLPPDDNKSECLLPVAVDALIGAGMLRCRALYTEDQWFGMTYPEDKKTVVAALRKLHRQGFYPPTLWGKS